MKIVLFGSFQKGDFHTWSDIDIAVIGHWHIHDLNERVAYLQRISIEVGCNRIQPIGLNEKELRGNKSNDFYKKIINGIDISQKINNLDEGEKNNDY